MIETQKIVDEEAQYSSLQPIQESKTAITGFLIFGVVASIAIGFYLAIFFNKTTGHRLAILMANTVKLAQQEPLMPKLTGSDEIARLDQVFHQMAGTLAEAARKERAIVDNAVDVICSIDADGRFARVNPAAEVIWGYEPRELFGRPLVEFVPDEEQSKLSRTIEKLKAGEPAMSLEGRLIKKDGALVDVLWSAHWSETDNALFCVAHDITERKELDRLKKEFVAMITHDLRSPLTGILFSAGLLSEGGYGELTERAKGQLNTIEGSVEQMLTLINDLLYVEKLEAGKMQMHFQNVPLSQLLERSVRPLLAVADHHKVTLVVPTTSLEVHADEDKLARVLLNLISNALKFSPEGGVVALSAEEKDGLVEIRVRDQGPGIPPDSQRSIFERFQQVDRKDRKHQLGTGLGLAICKEIVESHQGEIGVISEEGKGSTFWFRIPGRVASELKLESSTSM